MSCQTCPMGNPSGAPYQALTRSRGNLQHPVYYFVGEAPGKDELAIGEAFVGAAGRLLVELIVASGIDLNLCGFGNVNKCVPKDDATGRFRAPNSAEISACAPYMIKEILTMRPGIVIAVGNNALLALTGYSSITKNHGRLYEVRLSALFERLFGKNNPYWSSVLQMMADEGFTSIQVLGIQHPASALWEESQGKKHKIKMEIATDLATARHLVTHVKDTDFELIRELPEVVQLFRTIEQQYQDGAIECAVIDFETYGRGGKDNLSPFERDSRILSGAISTREKWARNVLFSHKDCLYGPQIAGGRYYREFAEAFRHMTEVIGVPITNHHLKYDYKWALVTMGIRWKRLDVCTMLANHFMRAGLEYHDMEVLLARHFPALLAGKTKIDEEMKAVNGKSYEDVSLETLTERGCTDVDGSMRLRNKFKAEMQNFQVTNPFTNQLQNAFEVFLLTKIDPIHDMTDMEINGLPLDYDRANELQDYYPARMKELLDKMHTIPQVAQLAERLKVPQLNINSSPQMAQLWFEVMQMPAFKRGKKHPSVNMEFRNNINELALIGIKDPMQAYMHVQSMHPLPNEPLIYHPPEHWQTVLDILESVSVYKGTKEHKGLTKMHSTYTVPVIRSWVSHDGLVHTTYNMHGTMTHRYSTPKRTVQTIPPREIVKQMYCSRWKYGGGLVCSSDESQAELRLLASLASETSMCEVFAAGKDIHRFVASKIYNKTEKEVTKDERRLAKVPSFAVAYGGGVETVARSSRMPRPEAEDLVGRYFAQFPRLKQFMRDMEAFARRHGYTVLPNGLFRMLPDIHSNEPGFRAAAERESFNTPVQGISSELVREAYCRMNRDLYQTQILRSKKMTFIHDSLATDVYPGELTDVMRYDKYYMETLPNSQYDWVRAKLAVDFEVGPGWGYMMEVNNYDFDNHRYVLGIETHDRAKFDLSYRLLCQEIKASPWAYEESFVGEPRLNEEDGFVEVELVVVPKNRMRMEMAA